MPKALDASKAAIRRSTILEAGRWCFLNFGFGKSSVEDIAKRAGLTRTLLYKTFENKEAIFQAVFRDMVVSRQPAAKKTAEGPGSSYERLVGVCGVLVLAPWAEMAGTTMGSEFLETCALVDPENEELHRAALYENVMHVLGDAASAEVFLLALNGLFADQPSIEVVKSRIGLLAARFCSATDYEKE